MINLPPLYDSKPNDPSARKIGSYILWTTFAASCVTSSLFITGCAPNFLAADFARKLAHVEITWTSWFFSAAPFGIPLLLALPLLGYVIYPPSVKQSPEIPVWANRQLAEMAVSYTHLLEDVTFLLNDVFQIDRYDNLPGFSDASADVREAVLSEAAKLAEEVLQPLNRVGDLEGCVRHDDGSVTTPKGFKEAYRQVAEGGWLGLSAPAEYGGQGLPVTLSQAVNEFQCSANMAFSMYGGLTMGATAALMVHCLLYTSRCV